MATNWQTGDVITAEKLNDLESRALADIIIHISISYENDEWVVSSSSMTPSEVINAMYDEESGSFTKTSLAVIYLYPLVIDEPIRATIANFVDFAHGNDQNIDSIYYQTIEIPTGMEPTLTVNIREIIGHASSDTWENNYYDYTLTSDNNN